MHESQQDLRVHLTVNPVRSAVDRLVDAYETVRESHEPMVVVLSGPSGHGKTRIAQSLHQYLTGRALGEIGTDLDAELAVERARKDLKDEARPTDPAVWLAATCGRLANGERIHAAFSQLASQVNERTRIQETTKHLRYTAGKIALSAATGPATDIVAAVVEFGGFGRVVEGAKAVKEVVDAANPLEQADLVRGVYQLRPTATASPSLDSINMERELNDFGGRFDMLLRQRKPVVVLLDDAQDVDDESLIALTRALIADVDVQGNATAGARKLYDRVRRLDILPGAYRARPVLIIITTWEHSLQSGTQSALGDWLQGVQLLLGGERVVTLRSPEHFGLLSIDDAAKVMRRDLRPFDVDMDGLIEAARRLASGKGVNPKSVRVAAGRLRRRLSELPMVSIEQTQTDWLASLSPWVDDEARRWYSELEEARVVVQAAALLGERFDTATVVGGLALDLSSERTRDLLSHAARLQFITPVAAGDATWEFAPGCHQVALEDAAGLRSVLTPRLRESLLVEIDCTAAGFLAGEPSRVERWALLCAGALALRGADHPELAGLVEKGHWAELAWRTSAGYEDLALLGSVLLSDETSTSSPTEAIVRLAVAKAIAGANSRPAMEKAAAVVIPILPILARCPTSQVSRLAAVQLIMALPRGRLRYVRADLLPILVAHAAERPDCALAALDLAEVKDRQVRLAVTLTHVSASPDVVDLLGKVVRDQSELRLLIEEVAARASDSTTGIRLLLNEGNEEQRLVAVRSLLSWTLDAPDDVSGWDESERRKGLGLLLGVVAWAVLTVGQRDGVIDSVLADASTGLLRRVLHLCDGDQRSRVWVALAAAASTDEAVLRFLQRQSRGQREQQEVTRLLMFWADQSVVSAVALWRNGQPGSLERSHAVDCLVLLARTDTAAGIALLRIAPTVPEAADVVARIRADGVGNPEVAIRLAERASDRDALGLDDADVARLRETLVELSEHDRQALVALARLDENASQRADTAALFAVSLRMNLQKHYYGVLFSLADGKLGDYHDANDLRTLEKFLLRTEPSRVIALHLGRLAREVRPAQSNAAREALRPYAAEHAACAVALANLARTETDRIEAGMLLTSHLQSEAAHGGVAGALLGLQVVIPEDVFEEATSTMFASAEIDSPWELPKLLGLDLSDQMRRNVISSMVDRARDDGDCAVGARALARTAEERKAAMEALWRCAAVSGSASRWLATHGDAYDLQRLSALGLHSFQPALALLLHSADSGKHVDLWKLWGDEPEVALMQLMLGTEISPPTLRRLMGRWGHRLFPFIATAIWDREEGALGRGAIVDLLNAGGSGLRQLVHERAAVEPHSALLATAMQGSTDVQVRFLIEHAAMDARCRAFLPRVPGYLARRGTLDARLAAVGSLRSAELVSLALDGLGLMTAVEQDALRSAAETGTRGDVLVRLLLGDKLSSADIDQVLLGEPAEPMLMAVACQRLSGRQSDRLLAIQHALDLPITDPGQSRPMNADRDVWSMLVRKAERSPAAAVAIARIAPDEHKKRTARRLCTSHARVHFEAATEAHRLGATGRWLSSVLSEEGKRNPFAARWLSRQSDSELSGAGWGYLLGLADRDVVAARVLLAMVRQEHHSRTEVSSALDATRRWVGDDVEVTFHHVLLDPPCLQSDLGSAVRGCLERDYSHVVTLLLNTRITLNAVQLLLPDDEVARSGLAVRSASRAWTRNDVARVLLAIIDSPSEEEAATLLESLLREQPERRLSPSALAAALVLARRLHDEQAVVALLACLTPEVVLTNSRVVEQLLLCQHDKLVPTPSHLPGPAQLRHVLMRGPASNRDVVRVISGDTRNSREREWLLTAAARPSTAGVLVACPGRLGHAARKTLHEQTILGSATVEDGITLVRHGSVPQAADAHRFLLRRAGEGDLDALNRAYGNAVAQKDERACQEFEALPVFVRYLQVQPVPPARQRSVRELLSPRMLDESEVATTLLTSELTGRKDAAAAVRLHLARDPRGTLVQLAARRPIPSRLADVAVDWTGWPAAARTLCEIPDPTTDIALLTASAWLAGGLPAASGLPAAVRRRLRQSSGDADATAALILIDDPFARGLDADYASGEAASDLQVLAMGEFAARRARVNLPVGLGLASARALLQLSGREPLAAASAALLMRKGQWPSGCEGEAADRVPPLGRHSYSPFVQAELLARRGPYDRDLLLGLATMHQSGGRSVVEALRAQPDSEVARELMTLPEGLLSIDAVAALLPVAGRAANPELTALLVRSVTGRKTQSADLWMAALDLAVDDPELAELGRSLSLLSPSHRLRVLTLLAEVVELDTLRRLAPLEGWLRKEVVDSYQASPSRRAQWLAAELLLDLGRRAGKQRALKLLRGSARDIAEACLTLISLEGSIGSRLQLQAALERMVRHTARDDRMLLKFTRLVVRDPGLRKACGALAPGVVGPLSVSNSSSPERLGAAVLRAKPAIGPLRELATIALTDAAAARVLLTTPSAWSLPTWLAPQELELLGSAMCSQARQSTEVAVALAQCWGLKDLGLTRDDVEGALRSHTTVDVRAFLAYLDVPRRTWSLLTSAERELLVRWASRRFAAAKALLQIADDDISLAKARSAMRSYLSADLASCVKSLARGHVPVAQLVTFAEPGSTLGKKIAKRCVEMLEYFDPTALNRRSRVRLALWSAELCAHHLPMLSARVRPALIALLEEDAEPALSTALLALAESPSERTVAIAPWSDRVASLTTDQLEAFVTAGGRFSSQQLLDLCDDMDARVGDLDRRRAVAIARAVDEAPCSLPEVEGGEADVTASARLRVVGYLQQDRESADAAVRLIALADPLDRGAAFQAAAGVVTTVKDYAQLREVLESFGTWESCRSELLDAAHHDPDRAIALLTSDPDLLAQLTPTLIEASASSWAALRSLLGAGAMSGAAKSLLEVHRDEPAAAAWAAWLAWSTGDDSVPWSSYGIDRCDNIVDVVLRLTAPVALAWAWVDLPGQRSQVVKRLVDRAGSDRRAALLLAAAAHTDLRWVPCARAALRLWAVADRDAACALAALPGDPAELAEAYGQLTPWELDERQLVLAHADLARRRGVSMPHGALEQLRTIWLREGPADARVVGALLAAGHMTPDDEARVQAAAAHDAEVLRVLLRQRGAEPNLVELALKRVLADSESALALAQVMEPGCSPAPLRLQMLRALRSGEFNLGRWAESLRWSDEQSRAVGWEALTDEARDDPDVAVICVRLGVSESERAEARHIARTWAEADPEVTVAMAAAATGRAAVAEARLLIGRHLGSDPGELLADLLEVLDESRLLELFLPGDPVLPHLLDVAAVRAEYEVSAADVFVGLALSRSPRRVHDALGVLEEHAAGSREAGLVYVRRAAQAAVTREELERADGFASQHPDHFELEFVAAAGAVRRRLSGQILVPERQLDLVDDVSALVAQALAEPRGPSRADLYERINVVADIDPEAATACLLLAEGPVQLHQAWSVVSEHARDRDVRLVVMAALSRCTLPGSEVAGLLPVDSIEVLELAGANMLGLLQGLETPVALMSTLTQIRRRGPFKGADRDIQSRNVRIALRSGSRRSLDAAVGLAMVAETPMQRLEATAAIEQWVVRGDQSAARAMLWHGPGVAPQESLELAARVLQARAADTPESIDLLALAVGCVGTVRLEARHQLLAQTDPPLEVLQQLISHSSPEETLELMGNELLQRSFHDVDAALTLLELTGLHREADLQSMVLRRVGTMVGKLRLDQLGRLDRAVQRLDGSGGDPAIALRTKLVSIWSCRSEFAAEVLAAAPGLLDGVTREQIRHIVEVEVRPEASTRVLLAAVTTGGTTSELAGSLLLDRAAGDASTALRCAGEQALRSRAELWPALERFAERDVRAAVALLACVEGSTEQAWIARGQILFVQGLRNDPTRLCLELTQQTLPTAAIVASLPPGEEQLLLPHLRFLAHGMESACVLYWEVLLALKRPCDEAVSLMRQYANSSSTAVDHLIRLQPAPVELELA